MRLRLFSDPEFIDDNFDGTSSETTLATLTNSWALLIDPFDPASSPISVFTVPNDDRGIDTLGVDLLMESNTAGIDPNNPNASYGRNQRGMRIPPAPR